MRDAAASATRNLVRRQQAAFAAKDRTVSYVDSMDLQGSLYDRLHFNKAAKLAIGARMAAAYLKMSTR